MDKTLQMSHMKKVSMLSMSPNVSFNQDHFEKVKRREAFNSSFASKQDWDREDNSRFKFLDNFYYFRSVLGFVILTHNSNFQFFLKLNQNFFEKVGQ